MMALYSDNSFQPLGLLAATMRLIGNRQRRYRFTHWDGIVFLETTKADLKRLFESLGNLSASLHSSVANSSWLGMFVSLLALTRVDRFRLLKS